MATWSPPRSGTAEREQQRAIDFVEHREDIRWLMGSATGRRIVHRLIDSSGVLRASLANNTATVQSALVAVRDFAMEHLLNPVLEHCPERFLEMKAEYERSTADG